MFLEKSGAIKLQTLQPRLTSQWHLNAFWHMDWADCETSFENTAR